ncbi:MAG: cupin domain-containing protein [Candidatus Levyibacteriota bacterium]
MFHGDIKQLAKENTNYRKVIYTGAYMQLVLMSIPKGGDIGMETHEKTDQVLFFVKGEGKAILNGQEQQVFEHDVVFVPAGTEHNFVNTGDEDLKLYTLYAPPNHPDKIVEKTKEEASLKEPEGE